LWASLLTSISASSMAFAAPESHGGYIRFDVPGAEETFANGINAAGSMAGMWYDTGSFGHGFVRAPEGEILTFDVRHATDTRPRRINDSGAIAGWYDDAQGGVHGFLRKPGGAITVFDAGGGGTYVADINNEGWIVGNT